MLKRLLSASRFLLPADAECALAGAHFELF
jgi:hypothetical protein